MASSGFYTYNELTGLITPDTSTLLTEVQSEYQTAFGSSLVIEPSTPQAMLINAETLARSEVLQINCTVANQINPDFAGGIFLDAILSLTGSQRTTATNTIVSCNLTGVPGTIVAAGAVAEDNNANMYVSQNDVTLIFNGSTGAATVNFIAVATGPITVAPNELTTIISNIIGWETITNPTVQSVIGSTQQTDVAARSFRKATLAAQGDSLSQAVTSGVAAVPGVTSLFYRENFTGAPLTIDGVTLVQNSLYLCVTGGSNTAIANVLNTKKSGGCNYNNAILITSNGTTTMGMATITGISSTTNMFVGQFLTGVGIPAGATILTVNSGTEVTMDVNATASGTVSIIFYLGIPQIIPITDPYSGQLINVLFDNPFLIPIAVQVTASVGATIQDPIDLIQMAILNYAQGLIPGDPGLGIGVTVSVFELAGAINIVAPSIYLSDVSISLASSISYSHSPIVIFPYQQATIAASNISVILT